ncbi:syntenin-1-like [Ornithodoros turicata]|uniref:syntenin-1-like n=1 Tax=Ornithodoros turicata TaxID=34597 RepID=UPI0031387C0E
MSSLYPTLEDMKVDHMIQAQVRPLTPTGPPPASAPPYPLYPTSTPLSDEAFRAIYPSLDDYMGLSLSRDIPPEVTAVAVRPPSEIAVPQSRGPSSMMVAPISGSSLGLKRAEVNHGIREVVICKDQDGRVGLRLESINKGVFVVLVQANSPAALAGLRFGDQILTINDEIVAGYTMDKVHSILKKASKERITMAVRDRPFERTVTMHKSSTGHVGFAFNGGKIISLVKDSSAARNGLLIDHQLLEVNGQNVVGLKDKDVTQIIDAGGNVITVTVMPSFVYDHMMKYTAGSILKKLMDHSVPDI